MTTTSRPPRRPSRPRLPAAVTAVALGGSMLAGSLVAASPAAAAPPAGEEPGVTMRTYFTGPLEGLCEIKDGTTPNVDKLMGAIDWTTAEQFGREDNFLTEVTANLTVPTDGTYEFRLTSDDGSRLTVGDQVVVDNDGLHGTESLEGAIGLTAGVHPIVVDFFEAGGGQVLKLEWRTPDATDFVVVPTDVLSTEAGVVRVTAPGTKFCEGATDSPGDGLRLESVHPGYDLVDLRPEGFQPMVSGLDMTDDGQLLVLTSGAVSPAGYPDEPTPGEVFLMTGAETADGPEDVTYTKIATDLVTPMGIDVVGDSIWVSEKYGLTELTPDTDGDGLMEHRTHATWPNGGNFHEFAFGLLHDEDYFYVSRSVAINNGGATTNPQPGENPGTSIRIDRETGEVSLIAGGLRTPNGMGWGPDDSLLVMDNQGSWLPANKMVHIKQDRFFNHYTNPPGPFDDQPVTEPVVWIPQNEIGNSPTTPVMVEQGVYAGQMIFGDVTYGGLQRAFLEEVDGELQGAVFRYSAGLEAGVNRTIIAPDGTVYVGGIGEAGNWSEPGKLRYGLQKLVPNGGVPFDMQSMEVVEGGFEITYTEPLSAEAVEGIADAYELQQWRYIPTPSYGGPKIDEEPLFVDEATVSEDRTTVTLQIGGLEPGRVVHLRSPRPFASEAGDELWNTEAWYTLNSLPGYVAPADRGYYEAEDATLRFGATVQTEHSGYSGAGFAGGFFNAGAELTFSTSVEEAGTYPVNIRFANGPNPFSGTKTVALYVNGEKVDPLAFPDTGSWKTWQWLTRDLALQAGDNTITLKYDDDVDGNVNLDVLSIGEERDICAPTPADEGYTALFDGTLASLDSWRMAGPGSFGRVDDCSIRGEGGLGLLWFTEQQFSDQYTLALDWKLIKDDNGGVFVGFPNPGNDPWVAVNQGYEIQIDATDADDRTTGAIYTFQGADLDAVEQALNPVGRWNSYEIQVDGDRIRVTLNGTLVNDFTSTDPARDLAGFIGVQNHGGGETVYYRDIQIKGGVDFAGTYEAEDAQLLGSANVGTEHAGFSGSGYVQGIENVGAGVTFDVEVDADGTYPLHLGYANGPNPFDGDKTMSLFVNGQEQDELVLPRLGDWKTWGTVVRSVDLQQGANTVTVRYDDGDDGHVNLDVLRVGEVQVEPVYIGTYEAEEAQLGGNASTSTEHAGYSGAGYVQGFWQQGAEVTFSVDVPERGRYPLTLRYANGPNPFDGDKTVSMYVNGTEVEQLVLPRTGTWATWGTVVREAALEAGSNTVTIRYEDGDDGNVNLDVLKVGESLGPVLVGSYEAEEAELAGSANTSTEHAGYSGTGYVQGFGDVGAGVTFAIEVPEDGTYPLHLVYSNGPNPFDGDKTVSLYVDGEKVDQWLLPRTGTWKVWATAIREVALSEGAHTVSIRHDDGDDGHVNLDALLVEAAVGTTEPEDTTAPVTEASVSGTAVEGWYTEAPTVTLTATDDREVAGTEMSLDGGDWVAYTEPVTVTGEGEHVLRFRSTDAAGNVEEAQELVLRVDTRAPEIAFDGARAYTVDETVAVTCTATDPEPGSGLAEDTCEGVEGEAWTFGTGEHEVTASATDVAGNSSTASATFTVEVTYGSLAVLVDRFVDDESVAAGLVDKLEAAESAAREKTRANVLRAFERQLDAAVGKSVDADEADALRTLARELR
ncbi:CBM35 domain-containing protein [Aquipuribacter sp. SD81]|uniref:CBM35 domain-containing protein n=1 Tax=Aquipuribacter sp. SD81 TaxID=3127703 RepID=UPI003019AA27